MLETIDARATIRRTDRRHFREWEFARSSKGCPTWTLPRALRPDGISLCRVTETPAGDLRARVEANLTALEHGPAATTGSLARGEVRSAAARLVALAGDLVGTVPRDPGEWDVHRFDPSMTLRLPYEGAADDMVRMAHIVWGRLRTPGQVLTLTEGEGSTCTLQRYRYVSWSVYGKRDEAMASGKLVPDDCPDLLRVEARYRPRHRKGGHLPTLALTDEDLAMANDELLAMMRTLVALAGASGHSMVELLMKGGADQRTAYRLAMAALAIDTMGPKVLERDGLSERTAQRWRSDIRTYLLAAGADDDDALLGMLAEGSELSTEHLLLARDLAAADLELRGDES